MDLYAQDTECIFQGASEIQGILNKEVSILLTQIRGKWVYFLQYEDKNYLIFIMN